MAGIGFKLRKIFSENSMTAKLKGVFFATFTTIGPTLTFIAMLLLITYSLDQYGASEGDRLFFSASLFYLFLVNLLIAGATGTILSRFIADQINDGSVENVPAALMGSLVLVSSLAALAGGAITWMLWRHTDVQPGFLLAYDALYLVIAITYSVMNFISAIKEYGRISLAFLVSVLLGIASFFAFHHLLQLDLLLSILLGMLLAFSLIDIILIYLVLTFFKGSAKTYFLFLGHFRRNLMLFWGGLVYMLTLYLPTVIFWFFSELSTPVAIFRVAPAYDMAMFLAILANVSTTIIFVVKVETNFFEKYQRYVSSLTHGTYGMIEKNRVSMVRTMNLELFYIYEVQLIITLLLTSLGIIFLPMIGYGGLVLNYFPILSISLYTTNLMYFTTVFLYYFDDQAGSLKTMLVFFAVTLVATLVVLRLGISYYPLPLLAGGIAGWIYAFLRLRNYLGNINAQLFCRTKT
ncbi:MAG: exopolysaccharide Pel transporter PelG [Eubacteriales bacterium]|nr:exopolysaccharide Pel transporter PelG [Eubacteriales bacterium]